MQKEEKHFLSHAAIYLVARGLPGIVAFLAIPLFSRLLEPADYGRYFQVMAVVNLLNALLFQWLRLSMVRYMPAYRDDSARLKATLATAALLLVGVMGLFALLASFVPAFIKWRPLIAPCWAMLSLQAVFELTCEYSRSVLQPWRFMVMQLMRTAAFIGAGAALILAGWNWWGPLAGAGIGMLLAIIYAYPRDWSGLRLMLDREVLAKVCHYGIPLSVTVALAVVISTSDRFIIEWFMGDASVGLYSVAMDFTSQTLTLLMMVINMAMFPMAVRAWEHQGREAAQAQMRSNASLLMAVGIPCVVGLIVIAPGIAQCFLGKSYRSTGADIIPLVALGAFFAGFKAYHFDAAFQFVHRTIYQVWIVLFAAMVNIGLNLVAVPRWGINGAACASLLAYFVSIVLTAWLGRRHFALPFPIKSSAQVLLAGGVMGLALYPFRMYISPWAVAGQIVGGAGLYGLVLLASNFIGIRDSLQRKLIRRRIPVNEAATSADIDMSAEVVEVR